MKLSQIAFRNIKRNTRRSLLSGTAITIAVMTIVFLFGFIGGMMNDYRNNVKTYITGDVRIRNAEFTKNEKMFPLDLGIANSTEVQRKAEAQAKVAAVTRRIQFITPIYGSPRIAINDVHNYQEFFAFLLSDDPIARFLIQRAPDSLISIIKSGQLTPDIPLDAKTTVLEHLSRVMRSFVITDSVDIPANEIPPEAAELNAPGRVIVDKAYYNRLVLDEALAKYLKRNQRMANTFGTLGFGVDFEREKDFFNFDALIHEGAQPAADSTGIVLTTGLAREMDLTIGDKVTIFPATATGSLNGMTFTVAGLMTSSILSWNAKNFFIPLKACQEMLRMNDKVTDILVKSTNQKYNNKIVQEIREALPAPDAGTLEILPWTKISLFSFFINYVFVMYCFIAAIFFLIASTVIINTTMMVIYERMREIGTVAAMGMKGKEIVKLFFLEAFFIALIAAGIGAVIGTLIIVPLQIYGLDFGTMMEGMDFPISSKIFPTNNAGYTIFVFIYAVVIASAASMIPSRRASKIQPVEALRTI
ncbi:MAG: ABC transporter permease [Spirochaetales bacterium]|nr:ABC transporter permease [Spirochaetales bacterium]